MLEVLQKGGHIMRRRILHLIKNERPFFWAIVLLTCVPLFPEYCAPVLAVGSLIAAAADAQSRQTVLQLGTLGKLTLLIIGYQLFSALYSYHFGNTIATAAMWGVMFCGYVSLSTVLCNRRRLHTALLFIGIVAGAVGFIACAQYILRDLLGKELPNQVWLKLDEWVYQYFPLGVNLHMADNRACATFNNPNVLAEYLTMVLPFVGYYGFSRPRTKVSLWMRGCLLLAVLGAVVSFSRGAYISLLSMLLLILSLNFKRPTPFILCLVAAISLIPEAVMSRFLSIGATSTDGAITERFEIWDIAVQTIISRPLFGLGAGISNFWDYLNNAGINAPHSHNLILQLLVEGGFLFLFLVCTLATKILQNSLALTNHRSHGRGLGFVLTMFVISFIVYGMVDYPFLSPKLVGNFLMIVGIAEAVSHLYLASPTVSLTAYPLTLWHRLSHHAQALPLFHRKNSSHKP